MLKWTLAAAGLAALSLCALPAAAAPTTVGSTDSGNCYPFVCNDSTNESGLSIDYYQVYAASAFSGITTFDTITFFDTLLPGAEFLEGTYEISFGLTTDSLGDVAYPVNITGETSFFSGSLAGSDLSILGTAFTYDPELGNLVMHVEGYNLALTPNGSQANGGYMDADYTGTATVRAYQNFSEPTEVSDTEISAGTGALVTRFSDSGAIPEPGTWALMLAGFGGLGALLRRQRRLGVANA